MKKGQKAALVIGIVCLVAGGALAFAGVIAGGLSRPEQRQTQEKNPSGDLDQDVAFVGELKKLKVDVGTYELSILEGTDGIHLSGENCGSIRCSVKDGTLELKSAGEIVTVPKTGGRKLVLTVPEGIVWEKADLEADAGSISVGTLLADRTTIQASAGKVLVETLETKKLEASAAMGTITVSGSVEGDVELEAAMGNISLSLTQEREAYDYKLHSGMGRIVLGDSRYAGMETETEIRNDSPWKMELESSMGNIELSFGQG